jgi:ABC-type bacteriocin/lantibiotic exporter with double-glycine peptidase domain
MINIRLIEKFIFPKIIFFYYRIFLIVINGLLELIGIGLLLFFIKIISLKEQNIVFYNFSFNNDNFSDLTWVCLLVISFYCLKNLFNYWFVVSQHKILKNAQYNLCKSIYYGYIQSKLNKLINVNTKKITQDINVETEKLFYEYFSSVFTLITETIIISFILLFFLYNEPVISIYLVVLSLTIYLSAVRIFFKKSSEMGRKRIEGFDNLANIVNASIGLFKELKVMKKLKLFSKAFDKNLSLYVKTKYYDVVTSELPKIFIELVVVILIVSIVLIMSLLKENIDSLLITLSMFAIGSIRIMPSINRVAVANHNMKFYGETISQLTFDLDYFNYAKDNKEFENSNSIKKDIIFDKVECNLGNKNIIKNLNLNISFGDKVLVLGKSGSGKTTFLKILSGLTPITSGSIRTGKIINKNFLRFKESISFLSQENFIVDKKSIFYNICLKDKMNATSKEINEFERIVKLTNLTELFEKLPFREETKLNENGSNLSGGEKQRICLARCLCNKSKLLIMDEPFSSIDKHNSDEIFKKILNETTNKTLILSNHKKIDLKCFNKIIIFGKKEITKVQNNKKLRFRNIN